MEKFDMDRPTWMSPNEKKQLQAVVTANVTASVTAAVTATVREEERKKAASEYAKLAHEYALKEKTLKRKAAEVVRAKEDVISYLIPPKSAKNDYMEQKPAKYIFRCMDGDIQIPDYGIFRTNFYNKERIDHLD